MNAVVIDITADGPVGLPSQLARLNMIRDPEEVKKVTADGRVGKVLPGPLNEWGIGKC